MLQKLPSLIRRGYVLFAVMIGFVLFNAVDLNQAWGDIVGLFNFAHLPIISAETIYYFRSYSVVFLMGIIGCTPLMKSMHTKLAAKKRFGNVIAVIEPIAIFVILMICTGYLVDGSFNPFLYFRF